MHLLLTDRLACPRCGPAFGLILLSDRMENRRIRDGVLGCPNCRDSFPIVDGFGDLRAPPRRELSEGLAGVPREADGERLNRLMALMGVLEGPGTLALIGAAAALGSEMAERIPEVEVVGIDADLVTWPEAARFSRMVSRPGIPFYDRTLRGVAVDGRLGTAWLSEAARTVAPRSRVVVEHAQEGTDTALTGAGLQVLASESGTVVATRA